MALQSQLIEDLTLEEEYKKKRKILRDSIIIILLFIIVAIPLFVLVYIFSSARISTNESNLPLQGAGSDFGELVYDDWFSSFGDEYEIYVSYEVDTTTQALKHLFNETYKISFAGSELTTNNQTTLSLAGIFQLPTVGASVAIIYNLPPSEIGNYRLNFTMEMVYEVYNGSLYYWDDIRIAQANYNVFPPFSHKEIIPLHFTSPNGATLIFTEALANFTEDWTQVGEEIVWPVPINQTITKSTEMMQVANSTMWSIGYVLLPYYIDFMSDSQNSNYSSVNSISLCTQYDQSSYAPTCDNVIVLDFNLSVSSFYNVSFDSQNQAILPPTNFTCDDCWPFNGFTYFYLNTTYYYPSGCSLLVENLELFLTWIFTNGSALDNANDKGYVLLQSPIYSASSTLIDSLNCVVVERSSLPFAILSIFLLGVLFLIILLLRIYCIKNRKPKLPLVNIVNDNNEVDYENSPLLQKAKIGEDELIFEEQIGCGSFGEVYKGQWRGTKVAIKRMLFNVNNPDQVEALNDFKQEAYIMSTIRHPNIVQFLGASMQPPHLVIVTELADKGSLFDVLKNRTIKLSFNKKINFCIDAAKGMVYLHNCKPPIIHRDLKTANLLVDKHWQVRVTDFGLSRVVDNQKTMTHCGTVDFCAPEVLNRNRYSVKADAYSFTLCVWQIFARSELFPGMALYQMMNAIVKEDLRPPLDNITIPRLAELLKRGWDPDPDKRPTMEEFLDELIAIKDEHRSNSSGEEEDNN